MSKLLIFVITLKIKSFWRQKHGVPIALYPLMTFTTADRISTECRRLLASPYRYTSVSPVCPLIDDAVPQLIELHLGVVEDSGGGRPQEGPPVIQNLRPRDGHPVLEEPAHPARPTRRWEGSVNKGQQRSVNKGAVRRFGA